MIYHFVRPAQPFVRRWTPHIWRWLALQDVQQDSVYSNNTNRDGKGALFRPWDTYDTYIDVWYIRVIPVSICVPLLLFGRPFRDMFYVLNFPFSFPLKFYPQSLLLLRSTCFHYKDFLHNFLIYRGPEPFFSPKFVIRDLSENSSLQVPKILEKFYF